jgi:putative transferase (TIGR04331 family)
MILITTADHRTIEDRKETLLLGEWCRLYNGNETEIKKIMPYPWADENKKKTAFYEIQGNYIQLLSALKNYLNDLHDIDENEAYWELVIGAWLQLAVAIIYERYNCLIEARDNYSISNTLIFSPTVKLEPADDYLEFSEKYIDDEWNLFIYSNMIFDEKFFHFNYVDETKLTSPGKSVIDKKNILRKYIKIALCKCFELTTGSYTKVYFSNSYFKPLQLIKLQLRLKQIPNLFSPNVKVPKNMVDWSKRNKLPITTDDALLNVMSKLIPLIIPKAYIESFDDLKKSSLRSFPKTVKLINTSISDMADEGFKLWAAEQMKLGVPLTINQHGGCYGVSELTQAELFQTKIAKKFYSWGWSEGGNVFPMPATKLIGTPQQNKSKSDSNENILLILFNHSRYSYWFQSFPVAEQMKEYFNDQLVFLDKLNLEALSALKIRYYPKDFGWRVEQRFSDGGYASMKDNSSSLETAISNSRLCIATYNATTFLETFSANIPTIIFWKPNHFPLRKSALEWYDKLKSVGILHDNAISAAKMVNDIYEAPDKWWGRSDVQEIKNEFCKCYALKSDEWLEQWAIELESMIKSNE